MTDLRPRRLLLSGDGLELLRRRVLPPPLSLPPGFTPAAPPGASPGGHLPAGVLLPDGAVHPSVAGDLELLARPEVAVTVRAARPGLDVTACVAVAGVRAWLDGAEAFLAGEGERTSATTTVYTVTNAEAGGDG